MQLVKKDVQLAEPGPVVQDLLRFWPKRDNRKQLHFLKDLGLTLEVVQVWCARSAHLYCQRACQALLGLVITSCVGGAKL